MKILLMRPICWILGHQHTQFKKIKSGNSTMIYGHGDPDNCLRCGKHTPQLVYFGNGTDKIQSFAPTNQAQKMYMEDTCVHGFKRKYCKYGCFERAIETIKNENLDD